MKRAFTLIELLIVVAIIAILAAIAVPNFLEAQTRSKVSRVKSDMRSVGMAIESYAVDNNGRYPLLRGYLTYAKAVNCIDRGGIIMGFDLTTPIAYMTSTKIVDPFAKSQHYDDFGDIGYGDAISFTVCYINVPLWWQLDAPAELGKTIASMGTRPKYFLVSLGPDYLKGPNAYAGGAWALSAFAGLWAVKNNAEQWTGTTYDGMNYDPSNGTNSGGDIIRHQ